MRTVAVVVTYNRCELLKECIDALLKLKEQLDIIIIDNASTDNTLEIINNYQSHLNVAYFNTGHNIGGAGGFNYGIRKAYDMGYDYIWIMDDDTIVTPNSLCVLQESANAINNNFGWLSSLALWTNNQECRMNYHEISPRWNDDKKSIIDGRVLCQTATFVSLFISRTAIKQCGLPIKEYFIWGDDTEYTKRISRKFPCYFIPKSQVIHKMKTNQATDEIWNVEDPIRIERYFYSIRNDLCTYRRIGIKRMIVFLFRQIWSIIKILHTHKKYKTKKIAVVLKGILAGFCFFPPIEYV